MLGYAMLKLFENPIISKEYLSTYIEQIHNSGKIDLTDTKISDNNIELLKISPDNLGIEEMSKIWTMLGIKHRPSAFYRVNVVLMREDHQFEKGLPVKEKIISVMPFNKIRLDEISNANNKKVYYINDTLIIRGVSLEGEKTYLVVDGNTNNGILLTSTDQTKQVTNDRIDFKLTNIEAGTHSIQVMHRIMLGNPELEHKGFTSNALSFTLTPQLTINSYDHASGDLVVKITPDISAKGKFSLILDRISTVLGDNNPKEYKIDAINSDVVSQSTFTISLSSLNLLPGNYLVRTKVNNTMSLFADDYSGPQITIP
jgi:hypothetical protein